MQRTFLHTNESPLSHSKTVKSSKKISNWLTVMSLLSLSESPRIAFEGRKKVSQLVRSPSQWTCRGITCHPSRHTHHRLLLGMAYEFLYIVFLFSDDHQPIFAQEFIKNYLLLASLFVKTLVIQCVIIPPAYNLTILIPIVIMSILQSHYYWLVLLS